jgi:hypothetical protein
MVDTGRLAQLRQELTQKNQTAMAEAKFGMAAQYARALDALQRWEEGGQRDEPPMDVARLLKINWTDLLQTGPAAQPETHAALPAVVPELSRSEVPTLVQAPPVAQVTTDAPAKTPHTPETIAAPIPNAESQSWQEMLDRANNNLRRENLTDAEMEANEVVKVADDPDLKRQANAILNEVRSQRRRQLSDALARARQVRGTQGGAFDQQKQLWEAVLQLEPDHTEAKAELGKLEKRRAEAEQRQQLEQLRRELEDLRKPLTAGRKDIRQVEEARAQAERIRNDDKTYSPERRQEANEIYTRLDELRQSIQRASDGGTSSERSEEFAKAVDVYRRAIQAGYAVIVDDRTGEPVEAVSALMRVREALFKQLIGRASTRYNEALEDIKAGAPETAVDKLVQCQELLIGVAVTLTVDAAELTCARCA